MNLSTLRQKYLDFFEKKNHAIIPSASLVPENDPTTLFTSSGMQPLIPYFFGQVHPQGKRICNSQKCFRSQDIEEVGDNRHTTFFEMLGNWSFGDYFKKEQLTWVYEFLTKVLELDSKKLWVTIFAGNKDIKKDQAALEIWQSLGVSKKRIKAYGDDKNWWSRSGAPAQMPVGEPGGPDSEIFYDFGAELSLHENSPFKDEECHPNCDCGRFLEIGNSVFMQYEKTKDDFVPLKNKNIDFGGGLERMLAAVENQPDIFQTQSFTGLIKVLEKLSGQKYKTNQEAFRVITDHVKAAVMLAADGVIPSNKAQGYFSRRLLRRAIRYGKKLGINKLFLADLVPVVINLYADHYEDLPKKQSQIIQQFKLEEEKFNKTLAKGLREFEKNISSGLTAKLAFKLFESYGFPLELSLEEAKQKNIKIEDNILEKFAQAKRTHAQKSRTASAGMFKGGLADQGEITVKYHTATHLLHAALRQILGKHVQQKGSNINASRLRFDFTHPKALTEAEKKEIQDQINAWIKADLKVSKKIMSKEGALKSGALAFFGQKYPDEVSVYTIGKSDEDWVSRELCGGPHVLSTGKIGKIKIFKEKSAAAGVRRIYIRLV